jgi:hypothetical protein
MSLVTGIQAFITAAGTDWKNIWAKMGTGALNTTATNLTAAINEVKATADAAVSGTAPDATESVKGIAELATTTEASTGTDTTRVVTPAGLKAAIDARVVDATESAKGIVELATVTEAQAGVDTTRAITAAGAAAIITQLIGAAPADLNEWAELVAAIEASEDDIASILTAIAGKQDSHVNLTQLSGLSLVADRLPYANGTNTLALATFTAAGRALVDDADVAAQRTTLSVYSQAEIGDPTTDFAAYYTAAKA